MLTRLFYILTTVLALPAWLLGLLLPLTWLAVAALSQLLHPAASPPLGYAWQLRLHAISLLLMLLASLLAMLLAIAAAYAFARLGRLAITWIAAAVLVVPPLVYGYLWFVTLGNWITLQSLPVPFNLPAPSLGNLLLAAWTMGLWLWPIPALLLTAGWQWTGRPAWLLARMDTRDSQAFLRAALPAMRPYLLGALAICLLLSAQDYAVPALFSVQTWQTQWLVLAQSGAPLGQLVLAALPPAVLLLTLIGLTLRLWRSVESLGPADLGSAVLQPRARLYAWSILLAGLILTTIVPAIGAVRSLPKGTQINPQRFTQELLDTPIIMAAAATLALAAALLALPSLGRRRPCTFQSASDNRAAANTRSASSSGWRLCSRLGQYTFGAIMLALAVISWTVPASLLAEAGLRAETVLLSILDRLPGPVFASLDLSRWLNFLVWVCVLAGRMLPIAALLVGLVARSIPAYLAEQAAVDGADTPQILRRILLPLLAPAAAAAWLVCSLLVATDTAIATLLRPPGFGVLSVSLLNQMHYGRDADVIAVCLLMLAVAAAGAWIVALTLGRAASGSTRD